MGTRTLSAADISAATSNHNHDGTYFKFDGTTEAGFLNLQQNTVGTTFGNGVATVPSYYFGQKVGDNDGWRLYGEAPASNDVKMIFEIIDDIEGGDTWVFRNKKTYDPYTANDVVKIGGEGNITTSGKILIGTVDANTSSTTALVLNGTEVEKRTLASGAFASAYSLPAGSSSTRGGFKIGYTESGKNYPVEVSSEKMYVNVPWTDNNTTYSVGDGGLTQKNFTTTLKTKLDGIAASANNYSLPAGTASTRGGFKIGYSENGKNYPVEVSSEKMYVNVPWTDSNTDTVTSVGVSGSETTGTITLTAAGATTLTQSGQTVEIRSTDTNTTYSVGDNGLTQKNFTTTLKNKLDGIESGADVSPSGQGFEGFWKTLDFHDLFGGLLLLFSYC